MTLDNSGNLGIGTTSPSYKLDVYGSSYGTIRANGGTGGELILASGGTTVGDIFANSSQLYIQTVTNVPMVFYTNNTERARIDSSGNLLVGTTTSPSGSSNIAVTGSILPALSAGTAVFALDGNQTGLTIANGATGTPFGGTNNFSGMFWVNDVNSGQGALFITGNGSIVLVSQTGAVYTTTSGTASRINVYLSSNVVTIQNNNGASSNFRVLGFRTRGSQ